MTAGAERVRVDLLLGSDIGLWALRQVEPAAVAQVLTLDERIAAEAERRGLRVWRDEANAASYVPSAAGLSVHYPRLIGPALIGRYTRLYNLHPGYLPWGRGYYPIFWALWEGTPAGATLHEVAPGIDDGPVVAQVRVEHDARDDGRALFERVRAAERTLFLEYWPRIVSGEALPAARQPPGGSLHPRREFEALLARLDDPLADEAERARIRRCLTYLP